MNGTRLLKTSVILLLCGLPAQAYLGNFESSAGYIPWQGLGVPTANVAGDWQSGSGFIPSPFSFNPGPPARYGRVTPDFTRYNAGQTGAFTDIADNTGLWVAAPGSGGRPQSDASNGVEKYQFVAIHDGSTRPVGETNVMCIRTEDAQSTLDYRYTLDSRDLAGIAPGDLTDAIYTFDYVFCPAAGADSSNISMLGFADDALTTALQVGTSGLGNFQYRAGSSGAITTTATMIGFGGWSEVSIVINTATDRASILVKPWDDVTNSLGAPVAIVSNFAVTNLAKITKFNFVQIAHVDKYFYDGFVMSASGGNLSCVGSLVANSSYENGNFSNFTTSDPDINGTLQTFGGSQSVFLSLDPGGNTLPDTPITGFRANTGNWVDASTNGGLGAKDGNRLFVIPPNLGANKCLYPNSSLGFVTQVGTCYRVCVWAAQFDVSSPNNPALESDFNFEFGDINGVDDPGATSNYSITPTAINESGSWNAITWKLPASTNVKDLNGNLYTGAVGQVVDWRTLNWQRICFDFTPSVTSARLETYMSSTSLNNGIALDGMCVELCEVVVPACAITSINVTPGACNDNGTPNNATDDYYTASVTVNYTNPPSIGDLVLSGPALHSTNSVTTVAVGSLNSSTSHTFTGVRLVANNAAPSLTAKFQ